MHALIDKFLVSLLLGSVATAPNGGLVAEVETDTASSPKAYRVILDPYYRTQLSTEVEFPIEKINFRMGDTFNQGDTIIQQDTSVLLGNKIKAEAVFERAKTELAAKQELYRDKTASLFELKEAEANVAAAYADLVYANQNLEAANIRAPYSGRVVDLAIEEHELPQRGKKIVEIIDDTTLRARLLLPSSMYTQVKVGDPIDIKIRETGTTAQGRITRIGSVIDPASSTFKAEAEINNSDHALRVGMTGVTSFQNNGAKANAPVQNSNLNLDSNSNLNSNSNRNAPRNLNRNGSNRSNSQRANQYNNSNGNQK